jgi:hypothetical protein
LISVRPKHQCDRGGRKGPNVAVNPCPPTKDCPLFHKRTASSLKEYVTKRRLGWSKLHTFRTRETLVGAPRGRYRAALKWTRDSPNPSQKSRAPKQPSRCSHLLSIGERLNPVPSGETVFNPLVFGDASNPACRLRKTWRLSRVENSHGVVTSEASHDWYERLAGGFRCGCEA